VGAFFKDNRRKGYYKIEYTLKGELSPIPPKLRYYLRLKKENCSTSGNKVETIEINTSIYIQAINVRSFKTLTRRRKLYLYYIEETGFITISIV
jgi:hypothetical protein